MTFAKYLQNRRSYTEVGFNFRQAVVAVPVDIDTLDDALAWLSTALPGQVYEDTMRYWWKRWLEHKRLRQQQAADAPPDKPEDGPGQMPSR